MRKLEKVQLLYYESVFTHGGGETLACRQKDVRREQPEDLDVEETGSGQNKQLIKKKDFTPKCLWSLFFFF